MNIESALDIISGNLFSCICHQDPSVLIMLGGKNIMLCPRCSGLHVGFFFTALMYFLQGRKKMTIGDRFCKIVCIAAFALLFFEWLPAQIGITSSTRESRFITGLLAGSSFFLLTSVYRYRLLYDRKQPIRTSGVNLITLIITPLVTGMLLFQINNWLFVTLTLLIAVVFNISYIVETIISRIHTLYLKTKIKPS